MSSTVIVVYRTRQIKVKCNPGTLIKEIKTNACNVLDIDAQKYDLRHGKTTLSGSTPFRLCNLVSNAKVDLVPAAKKGPSSLVKVRVQAVDLPPEFSAKLLDEFPSHTTVWNILKKFERQSGINFTERSYKKKLKKFYEFPTVQLFNRVLTTLEQLDESLFDLGIEDGTVSLRVRFEQSELSLDTAVAFHTNFRSPEAAEAASLEMNSPTPSKPSTQPTSTLSTPDPQPGATPTPTTTLAPDIPKSDEPALPQPGTVPEIPTGPSNVKIYNSTSETRKIHGEPGEMTLGQFNGYVNQLKSMSDTGNTHLMTKSMREAAEKEKLAKITQLTVRFRFPDLDYAEATFPKTSTTDELYAFVKSVIRHQSLPFVLFTTPPRNELSPGSSLVRDLRFGTRQVVFFEWIGGASKVQGPILKDEYLTKAKDITQAPEVVASSVSSSSNAESSDTKKKILSKPKWMKLSKK